MISVKNFQDNLIEVLPVAEPVLSSIFIHELYKTAAGRVVEQIFVKQTVRQMFWRRALTPSINNFVRWYWVFKFLPISVVFPASWWTVLWFTWIGVWKVINFLLSTAAFLGGLNSLALSLAVAKKLLSFFALYFLEYQSKIFFSRRRSSTFF